MYSKLWMEIAITTGSLKSWQHHKWPGKPQLLWTDENFTITLDIHFSNYPKNTTREKFWRNELHGGKPE